MARVPTDHPDTPWIETREGGLFFLNTLAVTPTAVVLFTLLLGLALRAAGLLEGPSRMVDTIPRMAHYFAPRVGWLALVGVWLSWKALAVVARRGARFWLTIFLMIHVGTVAYTVMRWRGG